MNYFDFHIGDYAEATAHLTFVEDAAYMKLLRKYYALEAPLPLDIKATQRLVGARTKEEKDAVQAMLEEFFSKTDEGWKNKRADAVIEKYQEKRGKAAKSASARWDAMRTDSERNANALPTQCEGNAPSTQYPVPSKEQERPASPATPAKTRKGKTPTTLLPADFAISDRVKAWAATKGHVNLDAHFDAFVSKARAKGYSYADWDEAFMGAIREDWAKVGPANAAKPPTRRLKEL